MNKFIDFFNLNKSAATASDIHQEMQNNLRYGIDNILILASAIIIASIGLNNNSVPVIIGAMLISPIMGPLLTLSYAISTSHKKLFYGAVKMLAIYIVTAIVISTLYFNLSFITTASDEIIARTNPTIFDFLIALFGGIAGIIGVTRKEKTNVIPGVAIATALMPPLCTVGYGLANNNLVYASNAAILFLTNAYLIILTSIGILKVMKLYRNKSFDSERKKDLKKINFLLFWLVLIPVGFNTLSTLERTKTYSDFTIYVDDNINEDEIRISNTSIDYNTRTIIIEAVDELTEGDKKTLTDFRNEHRSIKKFDIEIDYQNVEHI